MNTFNPIVMTFRWDKANFEKAFALAYEHQFKHSFRRYIGWFFIATAQFGVVAALKGGSVGLLMFSTVLIFYWYVVKKYLVYRRALSSFERSPLKNGHISIEANEQGIVQNGVTVPWEEIRGLVPIDEALLLYYKDKTFYIPESAFVSLDEKSRLKTLASQKGKLFHV